MCLHWALVKCVWVQDSLVLPESPYWCQSLWTFNYSSAESSGHTLSPELPYIESLWLDNIVTIYEWCTCSLIELTPCASSAGPFLTFKRHLLVLLIIPAMPSHSANEPASSCPSNLPSLQGEEPGCLSIVIFHLLLRFTDLMPERSLLYQYQVVYLLLGNYYCKPIVNKIKIRVTLPVSQRIR